MKRTFFFSRHPRLALRLLCYCFLLTSDFSETLPEDDAQPIHIKAQKLQLNRKLGELAYTGQVVVTQGGRVIKAEHLTLYKDNVGLRKIIALGDPAYYTETLESRHKATEVYGKKIIYNTSPRTLHITGNAFIQRNGDKFRGHYIEYLLDEDRIEAHNSNKPGNGDTHIEMIIKPTHLSNSTETP